MKKSGMILATIALLGSSLVIRVVRADDEKPKVPETIDCAVKNDQKVNVAEATKAGRYADYEYTRYYFCCEGCPKAFAKDPASFAKNDGVALTTIGVPKEIKCAVMSDNTVKVEDATDKGQYADRNGRRYYFCCDSCPKEFEKDPAKYAKGASVPIGALKLPKTVNCAVQGKAVVVEEALKKHMYADFKGRRYLFCCEGCPQEFKNDPAKFAANASLPSPKVEEKKSE